MYRLDFPMPPIITLTRVNIALLLVGIGAVILYLTCTDSCAGVSGRMFGIDLTYFGLAFLTAIGGTLLLHFQALAFWMLAAGVGSEIYLISYMVRTGDYCPFCLVFATVVLALAAVNFRRARLPALLLGAPAGFLLLMLSFVAAPAISYGATEGFNRPVFGDGPAEVRIYTDYFCGPCSKVEPELESKLISLVESGKARVVFVDVPLHRHSPFYASFFMAMLQDNYDIRQAIHDRNLLFTAAGKKINTPQSLAEYLKQAGCEVTLSGAKPDFSFHNQMLAEDRIRSTPTLVIRKQDRSKTFKGTSEVLEGIEQLMQTGPG